MHLPKLEDRLGTEPQYDPRDLPGRIAAAPVAVSQTAAREPASVLIAEESAPVRASLAAMLERQGCETICADSADATMALLAHRSYDLVLCGASTRGRDGTPLLAEILQQHPEVTVIVITTAAMGPEAAARVREGSRDVIQFPCKQGALELVVQQNVLRRKLQRKHAQRYRFALESSREGALDALLTALNTKDTEPPGHIERVTGYTMELADRLAIPTAERYHMERGALLHDIGKVGIPDQILHKRGKLSADEWLEMRKHPVIGYQMCAKVDLLRQASLVVLYHHERWDGAGYPDGLRGDAIPISARIFAVADALDALSSERPYRQPQSYASVRAEIAKGAGTQFDPAVVQIFLTVPEARWAYIRTHAAV